MNKVSYFSIIVSSVIALLVLIVLHVIPFPLLEVLILYIIIFRPIWFKNFVDQIYDR
jgi:hypothetical protein